MKKTIKIATVQTQQNTQPALQKLNLQERNLPTQKLYVQFSSPVGTLTVLRSAVGIRRVFWENETAAVERVLGESVHAPEDELLIQAQIQIAEYFAGTRTTFDLPLDAQGTEFQKKAWLALTEIPYGQTFSYAAQAAKLGDAKKARAIGAANGRNPLSILVPCHRVVGMNGTLTGFAGGLPAKKLLLDWESRKTKQPPTKVGGLGCRTESPITG